MRSGLRDRFKLVLCQAVNVLRQTRFVTSRGVAMKNTLVNHFVDDGNGRVQQFNATRAVARGDRCTQFLDLRAKFAAIATVDRIFLDGLSYSFLC